MYTNINMILYMKYDLDKECTSDTDKNYIM